MNYEMQFLPQYTITKWMFTCVCWDCLRIVELPAQVFLQGDPVCVCGSTWIIANQEARLMMEKLKYWDKLTPLIHRDRVIKDWSKNQGATFESEERE